MLSVTTVQWIVPNDSAAIVSRWTLMNSLKFLLFYRTQSLGYIHIIIKQNTHTLTWTLNTLLIEVSYKASTMITPWRDFYWTLCLIPPNGFNYFDWWYCLLLCTTTTWLIVAQYINCQNLLLHIHASVFHYPLFFLFYKKVSRTNSSNSTLENNWWYVAHAIFYDVVELVIERGSQQRWCSSSILVYG